MKTNIKDPVFEILETMLSNSPEKSYQRLNPALRCTLSNCIEADMPFQKNTFSRIYFELRGGCWFGDGEGSHIGEGFYTLACGVNHSSAQQSFEEFSKRPACLWEENVGTPYRLHVGAKISWKGLYLTVTSMRTDSLVACGYNVEGKVKKRSTITYAEIKELRRTSKSRVSDVIKLISESDLVKDAVALDKAVNDGHFRHFEMEEIQAAFNRKTELISDSEKVTAWRIGIYGKWLGSKRILLRVRGDVVECSNGNSVSKDSVISALPKVLSFRNRTQRTSIPIDGHTINNFTPNGVSIGCTLVPWEEIDLLATLLNVGSK